MVADQDQKWMRECLLLAAKGLTAPNPMVGSVIVKNEQLLGAGFHPKAGMPHAEVMAIADAETHRESTMGATLYVNLEPCNHYGRTPPCTEAIIRAGITKVVIGMIDPDPRVSGQGCDRLTQAGISITVGVLEAECLKLNEAFCHRIKTKLPFGILKYAMTLDGKIATTSGHSYWVTSTPARQQVHLLRSQSNAIVTGGNTIRLDNPHLTTHGISPHQPLRVVMTKSLDLPPTAHLWDLAESPTLVFTQSKTADPAMHKYLSDRHIEIITLENLSPQIVMQTLAQRGCNQVLWECGSTLAARAIADGVIQKIYAFIAPKIIGAGLEAIADLGKTQMTEAINLTNTEFQAIGTDYLITGYLG